LPNSATNLIADNDFAPVASFSGSPTNGVAPLSVTFTDTSTGTITNRFWDFGDGVTLNTTATNVAHTYGVAGTNTVTLIASGPVGVSTNMQASLITVLVYPPGDVNGTFTVNAGDSLLINQVAVNLRTTNDAAFAGAGYANGDVNQDGVVGTGDAGVINQVVVHLRSYVVTKALPNRRTNNVPTQITIYGVGFPTNVVPSVTIGTPVNLTLSNVVVVSHEQITALVPAGGGLGTGTVNVVSSPTNGVISFGQFINQ
jgi:PKD repeat protein